MLARRRKTGSDSCRAHMVMISGISWCYDTWNPFVGCQQCADECLHCYIERDLRKQKDWQSPLDPKPFRKPWGNVYLTQTWRVPYMHQEELDGTDRSRRIFTCSLSDFFIAKADKRTIADAEGNVLPMHREVADRCGSDLWRDCAWQVIRDTPQCVYLILTKRPENILSRLPKDWGAGYKNVWVGTSVGCNRTLSKLDSLRKVPVHPEAVRFVSAEPLIEDISENINLDGIGWLICGGESGNNPEYLWDADKHDWRKMLDIDGRRTMKLQWAKKLRRAAHREGIPFWFKQVTSHQPGQGEDALGKVCQEVPPPSKGYKWDEKGESDAAEEPEPADLPDSAVHVLSEEFIKEYHKRMPLARDTRGRIGQYRALLPKLEPPLPVGSFYMYQGNTDGRWHVCELAKKGRSWEEKVICTYAPDQKQDALKHLKKLVAAKNPLVVIK